MAENQLGVDELLKQKKENEEQKKEIEDLKRTMEDLQKAKTTETGNKEKEIEEQKKMIAELEAKSSGGTDEVVAWLEREGLGVLCSTARDLGFDGGGFSLPSMTCALTLSMVWTAKILESQLELFSSNSREDWWHWLNKTKPTPSFLHSLFLLDFHLAHCVVCSRRMEKRK